MDIKLLPLYFIIGGLTVAISAYFGSQGKGLVAAFASLFPGITLITIIAIHLYSGPASVASYARGTLLLFPAWVLYMVAIMFLTPRIGLAATLVISVAVYMLFSFIIIKLS